MQAISLVHLDIIEVHNRPSYVSEIFKNTKAKIVLYFHNDPLEMSGSKSIKERRDIINKTEKIREEINFFILLYYIILFLS